MLGARRASAEQPADDRSGETTGHSGHAGSASTTLSGKVVLGVWLLSVALHALFLALMFLVVFPYTTKAAPELPLAHVDIVGPIDAPPLAAPPKSRVSSETGSPDPLQTHVKPAAPESLQDLTVSRKPELSIIGIGSAGGDFSSYGLTAGRGPGPEFFGLGGGAARGARRIVYVVDRSGSMLDTFVYVRQELERSINALRRSQKFHVIFFNTGEPLENRPKQLVSAIKAQKSAFFEFLQTVYPEGGTQPERAMRRALNVEPELVYFLTDGLFDPSLVEKLDQWNRGRHVRIFTIAYFDRSGAALLERIAREHGGEFKFVSEHDVP